MRRGLRNSFFLATAAVVLVAGWTTFVFQNVTNSLPYTLLWWIPGVKPHVGSVVWFRSPGNMVSFFSEFPGKTEWYASPRNGFIKEVVAVSGDEVCNRDGMLTVNNRVYAYERLDMIPHADRLPWWRGCITLDDSQVMVGAKCVDDSIDSRYFGPISVDGVKVLIPLITLGKCDAH